MAKDDVSRSECLLTVTDVSHRPLNLKWHGQAVILFLSKKAEFVNNAIGSNPG